jgi:hypothetical protein
MSNRNNPRIWLGVSNEKVWIGNDSCIISIIIASLHHCNVCIDSQYNVTEFTILSCEDSGWMVDGASLWVVG